MLLIYTATLCSYGKIMKRSMLMCIEYFIKKKGNIKATC